MSKLLYAAPVLVAVACNALIMASPAQAQSAGDRSAMERCVDGVLTRLARSKMPEAEVGQAVVARCEQPLRATLAAAISSGEASICSVEACIGFARQRAAEEARTAYRERISR